MAEREPSEAAMMAEKLVQDWAFNSNPDVRADLTDRIRRALDAFAAEARNRALGEALEQITYPVNGRGKVRALCFIARIRSLITPSKEGERQLYRHKVRGTVYEIVGHVRVQCPTDDALRDDETALLYRDVNSGHWGARRDVEFHDGRFEAIPAHPSPEPGEAG